MRSATVRRGSDIGGVSLSEGMDLRGLPYHAEQVAAASLFAQEDAPEHTTDVVEVSADGPVVGSVVPRIRAETPVFRLFRKGQRKLPVVQERPSSQRCDRLELRIAEGALIQRNNTFRVDPDGGDLTSLDYGFYLTWCEVSLPA